MIYYNKDIAKRCFPYRKKYFYENIKGIPKYIKLMHFLIKNGYDEYACWETFDWFIVNMRKILKQYKEGHCAYPVIIDNYPCTSYPTKEEKALKKANNKLWDSIIDKMINLLDKMDENNPIYNNMDVLKQRKLQNKAKKEFFELFSKYFYYLWD